MKAARNNMYQSINNRRKLMSSGGNNQQRINGVTAKAINVIGESNRSMLCVAYWWTTSAPVNNQWRK
jgi:hypothetical protein